MIWILIDFRADFGLASKEHSELWSKKIGKNLPKRNEIQSTKDSIISVIYRTPHNNNHIINYNTMNDENRCVYLRKPNFENPQQKCVFSCETDLSQFSATPLITNCNIPVVLNHEITLVTGNNYSRTHHYAKMLATAILNGGDYPYAPSLKTNVNNGKVMWIDSVNSIHSVSDLMTEFKQNCNVNDNNFRMMCLDCLGSFQHHSDIVVDLVINAVRDFQPNFIVINDIDHLMPFGGHRDTTDFIDFLREITSYYNVAVCAIGHNLIGKVKNTTGLLGKELLGIAPNIFRVIDHGATSCVSSYKSLIQTPYDFTFTLNDRNLPQEVVITPQRISASQDYIDTNTLQDIFSTIIPDGKSITADQLMADVSGHLIHLARSNRARNFIANALIRGLITRDDATGNYTATPALHTIPDPRSSCFLTGSDLHSQALLNHLKTGYYDRILRPNKDPEITSFNTPPAPLSHATANQQPTT